MFEDEEFNGFANTINSNYAMKVLAELATRYVFLLSTLIKSTRLLNVSQTIQRAGNLKYTEVEGKVFNFSRTSLFKNL